MTPETKTKAEIKKYLDAIGAYHVPYFSNGYGRRGVPDRLICYRGRFVAIEVKAPGGEATPWQKREIAAISSAGGVAAVVRSVEDVCAIMETLK